MLEQEQCGPNNIKPGESLAGTMGGHIMTPGKRRKLNSGAADATETWAHRGADYYVDGQRNSSPLVDSPAGRNLMMDEELIPIARLGRPVPPNAPLLPVQTLPYLTMQRMFERIDPACGRPRRSRMGVHQPIFSDHMHMDMVEVCAPPQTSPPMLLPGVMPLFLQGGKRAIK